VYRLLEIGELTQCDDEYWQEGRWHTWGPYHGGNPLVLDVPVRRLIKPAVTPAATTPDPVVSVGDRVTVLSGPWAGCTGVVTGFETQVSLSQTSMRAMRDSVPVVRLDHVHVGGSRLVVKTGSLEKLAPVVPEVLFRDLSHGETIRQGDQFWTFGVGPWAAAGPAEIGGTINVVKARHRRPARLQSPGWRYLDAGETVQAGDEVSYGNGAWWGSCPDKAGKTVQDFAADCFRRKLPTISGG
jgi:hypothetical protein